MTEDKKTYQIVVSEEVYWLLRDERENLTRKTGARVSYDDVLRQHLGL